MMKTILKTEGLTKHYGVEPNLVKALDGVDLSISEGEFAAIVGRQREIDLAAADE